MRPWLVLIPVIFLMPKGDCGHAQEKTSQKLQQWGPVQFVLPEGWYLNPVYPEDSEITLNSQQYPPNSPGFYVGFTVIPRKKFVPHTSDKWSVGHMLFLKANSSYTPLLAGPERRLVKIGKQKHLPAWLVTAETKIHEDGDYDRSYFFHANAYVIEFSCRCPKSDQRAPKAFDAVAESLTIGKGKLKEPIGRSSR